MEKQHQIQMLPGDVVADSSLEPAVTDVSALMIG